MRFEIFTEEDRQRERELLASYDLELRFFEQLGLKLKQIVPERNCFRLESDKGFYCLKKLEGSQEDLELMQAMTEHLKGNGFTNTFEIVQKDNGEVLHGYGGSKYYLTKWMDGRESSYLNMLDIKSATEALARFHIAAQGFQLKHNIQDRRIYGKWQQGFAEELRNIQTAHGLLQSESNISDSTKIAINYLESCEQSALYAIKLINKPFYHKLNLRDEAAGGFIHHDYSLHNILHTFDNQTFIGGLECCAYDIRMHDLGHFIYRLMRRKGWDMEEVLAIIDYYDAVLKLKKEDYEALAAYFAFPHDYKQYNLVGREIEDLEELDRINIKSEYSVSRRKFLDEFERYSEIL